MSIRFYNGYYSDKFFYSQEQYLKLQCASNANYCILIDSTATLVHFLGMFAGKNGYEKVSFESNTAQSERPQSAAGQRRRDLTESDLENPPFTIEPKSGHVLVGQQQEFKVTFSPLDCVTSEGWLDCKLVNSSFIKA